MSTPSPTTQLEDILPYLNKLIESKADVFDTRALVSDVLIAFLGYDKSDIGADDIVKISDRDTWLLVVVPAGQPLDTESWDESVRWTVTTNGAQWRVDDGGAVLLEVDLLDERKSLEQRTEALLTLAREQIVQELEKIEKTVYVDWDAVKTADGFAFGATEEGLVLLAPATLIVGAAGTGKTHTLQMVVAAALVRGAAVYVGDTVWKGISFDFAQGSLKELATDAKSVEAMLSKLCDDMKNRTRDSDEVLIVIDEFSSLLTAAVDTDRLGGFLDRLIREGADSGYTIVLASQKFDVADIHSLNGLESATAHLFLGKG